MSSDFAKYINKKLSKSLRAELIQLYKHELSSQSFRNLIDDAGFPIEKLPIDGTPWRDLITKFLSICQSLSLDELNNIFCELYNDYNGNARTGVHDLKKVSDIFKKEVEKNKIDTQVKSELLSLYATEIDIFRITISDAGFPIQEIRQQESLKVVVSEFLNVCNSLDDDTQLKIFTALSRDKESSKILKSIVDDLEKRCLNKQKVDYTKLSNYLKDKKWKKADKETLKIMNKICEKQKNKFWTEEHIDKFPCSDLCKIDQLWIQYSDNKFGFTIQKNIWKELEFIVNKKRKQERFAEKVGWRQDQEYLDWDKASFKANVKGKNPGILPTPPPFISEQRTNPGLIPFLANKINNCQCDY